MPRDATRVDTTPPLPPATARAGKQAASPDRPIDRLPDRLPETTSACVKRMETYILSEFCTSPPILFADRTLHHSREQSPVVMTKEACALEGSMVGRYTNKQPADRDRVKEMQACIQNVVCACVRACVSFVYSPPALAV